MLSTCRCFCFCFCIWMTQAWCTIHVATIVPRPRNLLAVALDFLLYLSQGINLIWLSMVSFNFLQRSVSCQQHVRQCIIQISSMRISWKSSDDQRNRKNGGNCVSRHSYFCHGKSKQTNNGEYWVDSTCMYMYRCRKEVDFIDWWQCNDLLVVY